MVHPYDGVVGANDNTRQHSGTRDWSCFLSEDPALESSGGREESPANIFPLPFPIPVLFYVTTHGTCCRGLTKVVGRFPVYSFVDFRLLALGRWYAVNPFYFSCFVCVLYDIDFSY